MDRETEFTGSYTFVHGRLEPDDGMRQILTKLQNFKMLAGSTEATVGEFYYDPIEGVYWQFIQQEDYSARLLRITRTEIETKYPHVNCDRLIDVPR